MVSYTEEEQRNINVVKQYMEISYDPKRASATAVSHLCSPGNKFISPTTFPEVHTLEQYAEDHGKLMKQVNDLHFVNFDVLFAHEDRVCIRYTAEGTHKGEPHGNIPPSGKKATWTACGIFKVDKDGKLLEFIKEWNKSPMWEQFGWPIDECLVYKNK
eukprot:TRINITY_DN3995_c0_g1_i1.p1 TRINITY_DN3995_c0_g1~~TRINITY_DN3995_c0_g1_i1.p1  ORF type:complete len:158 (+),score=40.99 TRINITY_DN3995_c0_g1_i1:61-534(+)